MFYLSLSLYIHCMHKFISPSDSCHSGSSVYSSPFPGVEDYFLFPSFRYNGFAPVTCGRQFLLPLPWLLRLSFHRRDGTVGSSYTPASFPHGCLLGSVPAGELSQESSKCSTSESARSCKSSKPV